MNEQLHRYLNYLAQDETNAKLLLSAAQILHNLEKLDDAIALITRHAHHHDSNADLAGLLALLHFDNQNSEQAEIFFHRALTLNPEHFNGQLVRVLLQALRHNAKLAEIEELLKINPNESRLLFALGTTQMREMNLPAAEEAFLRAIDLIPNFYELWICMGMCQLLQNNLGKAEQAYQQAINIDPNTADGFGGMALTTALFKQNIEANQWLQKAISLDSDCFLIPLTQLILANTLNPEQAGSQFNTVFPDITAEINRVLLMKEF